MVQRNLLVNFNKYLKLAYICAATLTLASCGGEEASPNESTDNITITVSAPSDFSADENSTISLTANSQVSGGNPDITYEWLYLGDNDQSILTKGKTIKVTLPDVDKDTLKYFRVQAYVSGYLPSSFGNGLPRDEVFVTILDTTPHPPIANAGLDQNVIPNDTVHLSASESSDDREITSYNWQQISGPTITIDNSNSANASFTASTAGTLLIQLTVMDAEELSHSDIVTINVNEVTPEQPELSAPPIANAGNNQTVTSNNIVTLNAESSTDDLAITEYKWEQVSGVTVALNNANESIANFTAPSTAGTLSFLLTVSDNDKQTSNDMINVKVNEPASIASAHAGIDAFYNINQLAILNGSLSSSTANITSYQWLQLSGTRVEIINPNSEKASFTPPDSEEVLQFQLIIIDENGISSTDSVSIEIKSPTNLNVAFPTNNSFFSGSNIDVVGSYNIDNTDHNTLSVEARIGGEWISSTINSMGTWRIPNVEIMSTEGKAELQVRILENSNPTASIHYTLNTSPELETLTDFVYQGSGDIAYIIEYSRVLKVNLTNGIRSILSSKSIGSGPIIGYFKAAALDIENNRLLIAKGNPSSLVAVDLTSGDRTTIADGGRELFLGIEYDNENHRMFVSDCINNNIIAIDTNSLIKTVISSKTVGEGDELNCPSGLAYDTENNSLYILESWDHKITSIDVSTGNRTTISANNIGTGLELRALDSLIIDEDNDQLIVASDSNPELIAVNRTTGDRRIFTNDSDNDNKFGHNGITGLGTDGTGNWFALYSRSSKIRKYSTESNSSETITSNTSGPELSPLNIGYSEKYQQLIVLTNTGIEAVNPFSATKVFWSENEINKALTNDDLPDDAEHLKAKDICFNQQSNSLLYIRNQNLLMDSVISFDLDTRNSKIISDQNTGTGIDFTQIAALYCKTTDEEAYILNRSPQELYKVNLTSGLREKIMDLPNILGEDIELTDNAEVAYISSTGAPRSLQKIDLINKTTNILSSNDTGFGIRISNPYQLAFDEKHQRMFMIDYNAIILVDVLTGDRVIFSKE